MSLVTDKKLISVVIPVKNGEPWLDQCIQGIMGQSLFAQTEIVIIDSGSNDGTLEILKKYPVKVYTIPPQEFNHGLTRNYAVQFCEGKYIVMTVQDAIPASNSWLQSLVDGFVDDEVAGVCGQQIVPHDLNKNPALWFRPMSKPQKNFRQYRDPQDYLQLSPHEQRYKAGWDNVTSAYRRDILVEFPFPRIDFAEDLYWAKQMLLKGYKLAFIDEARVFHYHHHTSAFILPRYFSVYYYEYKLFGLRPGTGLKIWREYLISVKILLTERRLSLWEKFKWVIFNTQYWVNLKKTILLFNRSLDKGEDVLDIQYQKVCKKTPQAPKY